MTRPLDPRIVLRPVTTADIAWFDLWDQDPDVISASTDNVDATVAFEDAEWAHRETTHYWERIEPNLRAVDIWIGAPADRGKGYGETMMRLAFALCFADPAVTAIIIDPLHSNTRAHAFYQRLGFVPTHRQVFGGTDDCLVHRLTRATWQRLFPGD